MKAFCLLPRLPEGGSGPDLLPGGVEWPPGALWIVRLMRWFFHHLYTTIAFAYDAVAWLSSFGAWDGWRHTALHDLPRGPAVLEIGFGTGHLLAQARAAGHRSFGIDASPQMTRIARGRLRRRGQPAVIARARAQELPFPGGSFGACLSTFPSEYILDPSTLAEVRRVVKSGGRLVIVSTVRVRPRAPWEFFVRGLYAAAGQAPTPDDRWLEPVRRAGFVADFKTVSIPGADVVHIVGTAV